MPADIMEMSTRDPDEALDQLNRLYAPDRPMRLSGDPAHFDFSLRTAHAGDLQGGRIRHAMNTRAEHEPFDCFLTATVLAGDINWHAGAERLPLRRGGVWLYPGTVRSDATWSDLTVATLCLPLAVVQQTAHSQAGTDPADLRFHTLAPMSPALGRHWRALTGFVHRMLGADSAVPDNPLILAHLTDLVAATALAVFPNTTMTAPQRPGPGRVAPAALRRAAAYLDEHAAQPVRLASVASAARVSPRALQVAFRQHYGTTPMGYLRRVRLEGAHRDLQAAAAAATAATAATAAPERDSVTAVAYRWGFSSPSRFAAYYRDAYGVLPSHTLRS